MQPKTNARHVRATHVADVSAKTLRAAIAKHVDRRSTMNTDEALAYYHMSKEFAAHGTVNHSQDEYVSKDGTVHIQSAEAFFAILKRGVMGSFQRLRAALAALRGRICVSLEQPLGARCRRCGAGEPDD